MTVYAEVAAYIGRWRPSSVSPQAAAFARDVISSGRAAGAGAGEEPAVGGGQARRLRGIGLGLDLAPEVLLHPSVAERFTRCAPGLSAVARRTLRTNLRFIGRRVVPQPVSRRSAAAPGTVRGALQPGGDRRVPRPGGCPAHGGRRMRAAGLVCPGAGRRADPRRPARCARCRRGLPVRRGRGRRARLPAACGAGAGPLPRPAAGRRGVRRDRADLRRGRPGPPEHHQSADHRAGRRERTAAAGHLPAARDLAGPGRRAARAGHVHGARPGSAAPSGSATSSPGWPRPGRPTRSGCSEPPGHDPAGRVRGDHRRLRRRAADRGPAARRGAAPAATRAHPCWPG